MSVVADGLLLPVFWLSSPAPLATIKHLGGRREGEAYNLFIDRLRAVAENGRSPIQLAGMYIGIAHDGRSVARAVFQKDDPT